MVERCVVLVVDPVPGRRGQTAETFRGTPHAMVFADSVADARVRLAEARPDLVMLFADTPAVTRTLLAELPAAAQAGGALVYLVQPQVRGDLPAGVDGCLASPLDQASLEEAVREVTVQRAAHFAASAMEMALDALPEGPAAEAGPPLLDEPTSLTGPEEMERVMEEARELAAAGGGVTDAATGPEDAAVEGDRTPPEGVPQAVVQEAVAAAEAVRTNAGAPPPGVEELRAQAAAAPPAAPAAAPAEEDVFATPGGTAPPAAPHQEVDTDAQRTTPRLEAPAPAASTPVITAPPRSPPAANVSSARVVRLDGAPLAARVEVSSAAEARGAGVRVLDETVLGVAATRALLDKYRALEDATHHAILGVPRDADAKTLGAALVTLSTAYHPDRFIPTTPAPIRDTARAVYQRVTEAYRVLADPTARTAYEARLVGRAAPAADDGAEAFAPAGVRTAPGDAAPPAARRPDAAQVSVGTMTTSRRDTLPQAPSVIVEESPAPARSAAPTSAAPAMRTLTAPPKPAVRARAGNTFVGVAPPPAEDKPRSDPPADAPLSEDAAMTAGGRKFVRLAAQALGRNDLNGARLNLTFALGYEPDNQALKRRLQDVEGRMARPGAR